MTAGARIPILWPMSLARTALLALLLAAPLPLAAQVDAPAEGGGEMERGLRLFLDGLRDELEPGLRGLGDLARDAAPLLRDCQDRLGAVVDDLDAYEAPEILPNGDILIRRREPLPTGPNAPDALPEPEPGADGPIDL